MSWKNSAGKLSPARELMMMEPYHQPTLGGRTRSEYTALMGMAKAYPPTEPLCVVTVGGGGTRYDCFGGDSASDRSTLTYTLAESPSDDSGTQARRRSDEAGDGGSWESCDVGRPFLEGFCCSRAMYPGMLSLAEGVGWTYT